jgi:hypothetical protein
MEEEHVGYVDASIIQDAERSAQIKENMTNQTQAATVADYSTHQVLDILSEARRNIAAGVGLLNLGGSFAQAAGNFEMAANKLRIVQREYEESQRR